MSIINKINNPFSDFSETQIRKIVYLVIMTILLFSATIICIMTETVPIYSEKIVELNRLIYAILFSSGSTLLILAILSIVLPKPVDCGYGIKKKYDDSNYSSKENEKDENIEMKGILISSNKKGNEDYIDIDNPHHNTFVNRNQDIYDTIDLNGVNIENVDVSGASSSNSKNKNKKKSKTNK